MHVTMPVHYIPLSYGTLTSLVSKLMPGQSTIYHTGQINYDRQRGKDFMRVDGVAKAAYDAYERGDVLLIQRKVSQFLYEYIMVKARNAAKALPRR